MEILGIRFPENQGWPFNLFGGSFNIVSITMRQLINSKFDLKLLGVF